MEKQNSIDLVLSVLSVSRPGTPHTQQELASACGCSQQVINRIEQQAKAKLRRLLAKPNH
jgi:hypothetical protein